MKKPSVFVSSTCYDLKQVRSDMRQFLETLGLDPVLSEYGSFPVNPELGTLDNCLKAVETRADIFILIVGARYGSATNQGESITNLEFLTAKAKAIPVYVFVMRSVLDILPVWKANPTADYSHVADSARLFEFVARLKDTGDTWVFPFETAQDIFEVLRLQLAYLFMDALELRLRVSSTGGLSPKFKALRGTALRLLIERPPGWEYLLFTEALYDRIRDQVDLKRDWQYGVALGPGSLLRPSQLVLRIREKCEEAVRIAANLEALINEVWPAAAGPPGTPADPEAILYVVDRVGAVYRDVLDWKLDFQRLAVPEEMQRLK